MQVEVKLVVLLLVVFDCVGGDTVGSELGGIDCTTVFGSNVDGSLSGNANGGSESTGSNGGADVSGGSGGVGSFSGSIELVEAMLMVLLLLVVVVLVVVLLKAGGVGDRWK
ncbi:hypothetical protein ACROYT_G027849 [Oculina patagonica]